MRATRRKREKEWERKEERSRGFLLLHGDTRYKLFTSKKSIIDRVNIPYSIKAHAAPIDGCLYFYTLHCSQPVVRWYRLQYLIDHCSNWGHSCEDFVPKLKQGRWSRRCTCVANVRITTVRKRRGPVTICALITEYKLILRYSNSRSSERGSNNRDARPPRPHPLLNQQIKVKLLISLTQLPLQEHRVVFSVSVKRKKKRFEGEEKYRSSTCAGRHKVNGTERALDGRPRVGGIHRSRRRWIVLQWGTYVRTWGTRRTIHISPVKHYPSLLRD